jgi:hypothetical protein
MTEPAAIELTEFERVDATPGTVLLRLAARAMRGTSFAEPHTLVVDDGRAVHRLSALPAAPDPSGLWRAAFSAPARLLGPHSCYSLELSDGSVVNLPAPIPRPPVPTAPTGAAGAAGAAEEQLLEERRRREQAESELVEVRNAAAALMGELEEAQTRADTLAEVVRVESGRRESLERELDRVRAQLERARQIDRDESRRRGRRGR